MIVRTVRVLALIVVTVAAIELASLQVARSSVLARLTGAAPGAGWTLVAGLIAAVVGLATAGRGAAKPAGHRNAALFVFAGLFAAGLYAQLQLGARLQSDGFYYFSYLRSLWFDRDVDFTNDYRMLGLTAAQHEFLYTPTITGHAQTAWSIGPALVWSPFFAAGDITARALRAGGADVAVDGTSFPYRQAVCVAGLFYGLLGAWCCWRLAGLFFPPGLAAAATAATLGGSFMLWYFVREPSMSHAPSMAAVAAFLWSWAATRGRDGWRRWAALGVLAGLMMCLRWQNAIFLLLPVLEMIGTRGTPLRIAAGAFAAGVVAGFLPQMLAWQAIYGRPLALSPISPQLRWWAPQIQDVLWSSRNGLFALSPVLYAGAIGLGFFAAAHRRLGVTCLAIAALMTYLNASVEDWWGGAGFGGRRFDSLIPLFVLGSAALAERARAWVARHPAPAAWTALGSLVVWNLTFMDLAASGAFRIGQPLAFEQVAAGQAAGIERWVGHPFSWPANLAYAVGNGIAPTRYDLLRPNRFLTDPNRPYGRVDVGTGDGPMLGAGWYGPEHDGPLTFRWASPSADVLVPLDHAAPLLVQIQLQPFDYPGAPAQLLTLVLNGQPLQPVALRGGWQRIEVPTDRRSWHAGINRLTLTFARADRPADRGAGGDTRALSAAVDYVRVQASPGQP